jgi:hypothetical protein
MRCKGSRALRAMGWEPLLHAWGAMLEYYDDPPPRPSECDIAYWYGERPLNGLLAAAAWQVPGGWSLPEFTTGEPPQAEEPPNLRRGDMWLGFAQATFTVEAKVAWVDSTVESAVTEIWRQLRSAHDQLMTFHKSYPDYCAGCPMAVVYAVPWFPVCSQFASQTHIRKFFGEIPHQFASPTTVTAAYRCRGDPPRCTSAKYGEQVYPGVILIGRYWRDFTGEDFRIGITGEGSGY